jgi:hypothetical protein
MGGNIIGYNSHFIPCSHHIRETILHSILTILTPSDTIRTPLCSGIADPKSLAQLPVPIMIVWLQEGKLLGEKRETKRERERERERESEKQRERERERAQLPVPIMIVWLQEGKLLGSPERVFNLCVRVCVCVYVCQLCS